MKLRLHKIGPLRRRLTGLLLLALGLSAAIFLGIIRSPNPKLGVAIQPVTSIAHLEVSEASGLVQSALHPDRLWLHNDSGDVPRLFAIGIDGEVIVPVDLARTGVVARKPREGESLYHGISVSGARLVDWEDIARHDDRLYIAEMGNNLNNRRDLGVYEVLEPDPTTDREVRSEAFIPVAYPDQSSFPPNSDWDFDCEAIFWWGDHLYFLTKTRPAYRVYVQGSTAALYRLDSMDPERVNTLTKVDQSGDLGGWVTAADSSQDGRYLAILIESPVQSVWLFEKPVEGDRFFSGAASVRRLVFHDGGQLESLAFFRHADGHDEILMVNEERALFRLSLDDFPPVGADRK